MGRPKLQLNVDQIVKAASWGCTVSEIASLMDCSEATLTSQYLGYINKGRQSLGSSLKQRQVELAMGGNVTMLIWLGKQYMGQSDKSEVQQRTSGDINVVVKVVEDDDWYGNRGRLTSLGIGAANGNGKPSSNGNGRVRLKL
jgi:hypothetical protein